MWAAVKHCGLLNITEACSRRRELQDHVLDARNMMMRGYTPEEHAFAKGVKESTSWAHSLALFSAFGTLMQRFQEPRFSDLYPQKRARIIQLNERLAHSTQRLRDKCERLRQRIAEEEKEESLRTVEV